jgi:type II secretory pathway pseudopilin PulG
MAALLVALAVMAVLMSVAMPVWRHEAQREREEELVFRGQQYTRAIRLFQAKHQTFPTSVDMLVQGHFLRKKYKDPITNDDFDLVGAATAPGQTTGLGGQGGRGPTPGAGGAVAGGTVPGGLLGVRSKSKDESIRLFNGRNHYNEWTFTFVNQQPGGPGGRGQPGRGNSTRGGGTGFPGGPTNGGPITGGPVTGGPVNGGPVNGGPVTGRPTTRPPGPGGSPFPVLPPGGRGPGRGGGQ